jgi:predicted transposase YdaD
MQESVIYQELREEAREEVRQEERLEEARSLILRQLARKVGEVPTTAKLQIEALSLAQLEELGEALLNFTTLVDLSGWLERSPK